MDELQKQQIQEMIKQELQILFGNNKFIFQKDLQIWDGKNIQAGKTAGLKIGTETSQKLGFFNAVPVIQQTPSQSNQCTENSGS